MEYWLPQYICQHKSNKDFHQKHLQNQASHNIPVSLCPLVVQCFGDDRQYIEFYLEHRFNTENMFVIYEENRPVSMASLLPIQVTMHGNKENARYVYAVGTLPAYRNRGYASKIIKHAAKRIKEPLVLPPQN